MEEADEVPKRLDFYMLFSSEASLSLAYMYATEFEHWLPLPCSAEVTLPLMRLRTYIVARSFVKNSRCYRLPGPVRGAKNCYRRAYQRVHLIP